MEFYSRKNMNGDLEILENHLKRTSELAQEFAQEFNNEKIGKILGLIHDVGKRTENFQKVLSGKLTKIDHAIVGGILLNNINYCKSKKIREILSNIVSSHHSNLDTLRNLNIPTFDPELDITTEHKQYSVSSKKEFEEILNFIQNEKLLEKINKDEYFDIKDMSKNEIMFYTRMLFSCLVDADYCASAEFEDKDYLNKIKNITLDTDYLINKLENYRKNIIKKSTSNKDLNKLRNLVYNDCVKMSNNGTNFFTLTAPTGTAKTLALLAFALNNAKKYNKKRIFIVLPFLSIIEQNVKVYKEVCGDNYVLEDDSRTEFTEEQRIYSDRWDSPITVITSVKFFEALFKSKSTDCRKLHNLANSVIIFDESQTLPTELAGATISILNSLVKNYNTTVVFSTATQCDYSFRKDINWKPIEIISDIDNLYSEYEKIKKIIINWDINKLTSVDELTDGMIYKNKPLAILNTKKQAKYVFDNLITKIPENECYYLTTQLCQAHRDDILNEIKMKLKNNEKSYVVSTQCIEAGVDIDMKGGYRELAPYPSIIQSAGRIQRNALSIGELTVFLPDWETNNKKIYPGTSYKNDASNVKDMLSVNPELNINELKNMKEYSRLMFNSSTGKKDDITLTNAIDMENFEKVSEKYKLINSLQNKIIVPYSKNINKYRELVNKIRNNDFCITKQDMKDAQSISVNYYKEEDVLKYCERLYLSIKGDKYETSWFILDESLSKFYNNKTGLNFDEDDIDLIL